MAKTTTAACLKPLVPSRALFENYLKVYSRARDHSCTQTKFHVDPCRDSQDYPVTKNAGGWTDRQTDGKTAFQLYIVDNDVT